MFREVNCMQIILYKNNSDNRVLNKSIEEVAKIDVILKTAADIMHPVILLQSQSIPAGANYCYIEKFNRYYYIITQNVQNSKVNEIELSVDVLMSFKNTILTSTAVAERTSNKYNRYLPDVIPTMTKYNNVYKLFAPPAVGLPFYSDGITAENYSILLTVLKG